jgi:hypothetical protein
LAAGYLVLYLRTLCPTVYLGDSGEIATAIATGGVIHPPGYPLYGLLGRLALWAVPLGEPAFRIGCVTALAAAVAVAVLYLLAREAGARPATAFPAAGLYGVGFTFWSQSTRVEVYSLHVLLALVVLLGTLRYRRSGRLGDLALAAGAAGLGLGHHLTLVLLAPAALILCGPRLWNDPKPLRRVAVCGALLALGPALWLLLMVWARTEPLQSWGHAVTLPLLWGHVTARLYQGVFLKPPDVAAAQAWARELGRLAPDNFPWLLGCLVPLGAWSLARRDRGALAGLGAAAFAIAVFNLCYRIADIAPYYLVPWALGYVGVALGIELVRSRLRHPGLQALALVAAFCAVPLVAARNAPACDLSRATWVREFARQKLESVDPNGVLITQDDPDCFPIWYVHDLLRVRPDVLPLDRLLTRGAWNSFDRDPSLWYLYRLRRQGVGNSVPAAHDAALRRELGRDGYLIRLLEHELRNRPLCVTFLRTSTGNRLNAFLRWVYAHRVPVPLGLVIRLHPATAPVQLPELIAENRTRWERIALPDLHDARTDQEMAPDYVIRHYSTMLTNFAGLYESAGRSGEARVIQRRLEAWTGPNPMAVIPPKDRAGSG